MSTITTTPVPASPSVPAYEGPVVGQPVLVSFFDGNHNVHLSFAHVLAVGGIDPITGKPTISVAYPDPAADPKILASAAWYKGYIRQTGVQHLSHPDVQDSKLSIAYGESLSPKDAPLPFSPQPAGTGINPIFDRSVDVIPPEIAQGLHGAPALRSEFGDPVPIQPLAAHDAAIEAADQNAHNADVAAEQAAHAAADAQANADVVHGG